MYMIYCDTSTLINCTPQDLDSIIKNNTSSAIQLNNNVWFANIKKTNYHSMLSAIEDFFYEHIDKLTAINSVFIITKIDNNIMYDLPENVHLYLSQNDACNQD